MFKYIFLGLLIVLLICLIYWICRDTDEQRRKAIDDCLNNSSGIYDAAAQEALNLINFINRKTPDDYFTRGNIIRFNYLEGTTIRNRENEFQRQNRHNAIRELARNYEQTLNEIHGGNQPVTDPRFIIHTIEEFDQTVLFEDAIVHDLLRLRGAIETTAPMIKKETARERRNKAVEKAETKSEAVKIALNDASVYTNDRQNVHDSKVSNDLRSILYKLRMTSQTDIDPAVAINECKERITHKKQNPNAMRTMKKVEEGSYISTFNDTEDNIFALVWERSKHPKNSHHTGLMQDAVIDALADSVERGDIVCINGRCARILNSLAVLDFDKEISETGALTFEAYKNQVYQDVKLIIDQEINRALESGDQNLREAALAYDTGSENNEIGEVILKNNMRNAINTQIDSYSDKLTEQERNNLKAESYVYALID